MFRWELFLRSEFQALIGDEICHGACSLSVEGRSQCEPFGGLSLEIIRPWVHHRIISLRPCPCEHDQVRHSASLLNPLSMSWARRYTSHSDRHRHSFTRYYPTVAGSVLDPLLPAKRYVTKAGISNRRGEEVYWRWRQTHSTVSHCEYSRLRLRG